MQYNDVICYNLGMNKGKFKYNWPLIGNSHITDFLGKSIENDNINGTYIFNGPDNLGKTTIAKFFAQCLLCSGKTSKILPCDNCLSCKSFKKENVEDKFTYTTTHSDFYLLKPEKDKKNISVEQVRDFVKSLSMTSFLNSYKIGIIKHSEKLSKEAANALLKTLEEPRSKVVIILITDNVASLLPTIVSRSQVISFFPVKNDIIYDYLMENGASRSLAKNYSSLCLGRPALAMKFLESEDFKEQYYEKMYLFANFFNQDINTRIMSIEEHYGKKLSGQDGVKIVRRSIDIWLGIVRDLILIEFGNHNLIQHHIILDKITQVKGRIDIKKIVEINNSLKIAKEYLSSNVNPKLILEQIAINI